jgi:hypothetical protein
MRKALPGQSYYEAMKTQNDTYQEICNLSTSIAALGGGLTLSSYFGLRFPESIAAAVLRSFSTLIFINF